MRIVRVRWLLDTVAGLLEASRRSSEAVLETLDRACRSFDERIDGVLFFAPSGEDLACVYAAGKRAEHCRRLVLAAGEAHLLMRAARAGGRVLLRTEDTPLLPADRFAVAAPMLDGRRLLAVAYVASYERLPASFGDALAPAIERAAVAYAVALEREAERAGAMHDGLTGLLLPEAFRHRLHDEVAAAAGVRGHRVLCLWFVDTDRFKEVNDRFGHAAGDAVLKGMATLLESSVTAGDCVARNGGDEFCVLLRGVSKARGVERARALCDAVRRHGFGLPVRITASVGIATYPYDASSAGALLGKADAAMYRSKRDGRDRVSFFVASGAFATLRPEAASELSRSPSRCRFNLGESSAERSSS